MLIGMCALICMCSHGGKMIMYKTSTVQKMQETKMIVINHRVL